MSMLKSSRGLGLGMMHVSMNHNPRITLRVVLPGLCSTRSTWSWI